MVFFGIGIITYGDITLGYLQDVNLDFNYETVDLYGKSNKYPIDSRVYEGSITGSAAYADINAIGINKFLGGEFSDIAGTIDIDDGDSPETFQLTFIMTTDGNTFTIVLNKCQSNKLSMEWDRESHIIPNFDFEAVADSTEELGTITLHNIEDDGVLDGPGYDDTSQNLELTYIISNPGIADPMLELNLLLDYYTQILS